MNQNYFKNISNRTSPTNFQYEFYVIRRVSHGTQQYMRIVVNKNPREASLKLLRKKSSKDILPKYLLHINSEVEKEKLLHEIEQQNLKLRQQFTLKKSLQKKLMQKINPQQPKLQLKKGRKTFTRKCSSMSKTLTTSSSQMHLIAKRSVQNQIMSLNNQIQALMVQKEKNNKKIEEIKKSKRYTRFIENQQQKLACLTELNQLRTNLKKLRSQMTNMKRSYMQKKKLRIKQLLMQGEIQNTIQLQNIQLYQYIESIKEELMNVSSKKASMFIQKQKLIQEIDKMKEMYDIPVEVFEEFYRSKEASKKWATYSSFNSSGITFKKRLNKNDMPYLKEQASQEEQDSMQYDCRKNLIENQIANRHKPQSRRNKQPLSSDNKQSKNFISQEQQRKQCQQKRKTIEELQKKYFNKDSDQNYEQDYQQEDLYKQTQSQNESEQQYGRQDEFQSEEKSNQFEEFNENNKNQINQHGHFGTAKANKQQINKKVQGRFMNRVKRGVSF